MTDLIERLREWCQDWDGSEMADAAETRTTVDCRTMREAADELSALRERVEALEGAARAVCDGQGTPASVNNLRAILAQQPTSLQKMQRTPAQQGGEVG